MENCCQYITRNEKNPTFKYFSPTHFCIEFPGHQTEKTKKNLKNEALRKGCLHILASRSFQMSLKDIFA